MQPLFCSADSPYGIHLAIRDNVCARCGWTAPRAPGAAVLSIGEIDSGAAFLEAEEDGGRAA